MKIVFLASAEQDLKILKNYVVTKFSTSAWQKTYSEIKEKITKLVEFPNLGSIPPQLEELGIQRYRQLLIGQNRVIYEVSQDFIYIHIICDVRRNFTAVLTERILS